MKKVTMQADCANMIGTEVDNGNIVEYRCKHYAMTPPPCHMKIGTPCWVDLFDCKNRIPLTAQEYMAQFKDESESPLAQKEQVLIDMFQKGSDVDDWVIESFADILERRYPGIFKRQEFIAKCKQR